MTSGTVIDELTYPMKLVVTLTERPHLELRKPLIGKGVTQVSLNRTSSVVAMPRKVDVSRPRKSYRPLRALKVAGRALTRRDTADPLLTCRFTWQSRNHFLGNFWDNLCKSTFLVALTRHSNFTEEERNASRIVSSMAQSGAQYW